VAVVPRSPNRLPNKQCGQQQRDGTTSIHVGKRLLVVTTPLR
jgi:hypothetical protein